MPPILKVSQLNRYVKSQLESDARLKEIYVAGEIGTMNANLRSGHLYFTLRDDDYSVRAVMFAGNAAFLKFMPKAGLAVIARGSATLYDRDGSFQIIVSELMLDGGAMGFAFEKQKRLLAAKGYFDEAKKRAVPHNASAVGVVTSESGAALHDIISVIERRNPSALVLFCPAAVQGTQAARSVAAAVEALNRDGRSEVLIVGRGGGSAEDLWCFNEEAVVKAVAESKIPVISAVGHETDITLCDLAADMRAATPTAAAELAVGDKTQQASQLLARKALLKRAIDGKLESCRRLLNEKASSSALKNGEFLINKNRQKLNNLISSMYNLSHRDIEARQQAVSHRAAMLESLSPLRVLSRGYSITQKNGNPVAAADELCVGDMLSLKLFSGAARVEVVDVYKENEK